MKSTADSPLRRNVIISNELGLPARAAARIAKLADKARSKVFIMKGGREADGTDIIDVMSLYCPCGTEVTVRITDPADGRVLNGIVRLIEAGFGE